MPLTIRHGDSYAVVSDDLERDIRRAIREVAGPVVEEVEAATDRLYRQARDLMPVKSGRTRDSLRKSVEITTDGQIRGRVTARKAMRYINSWQIGSDTPRMNKGTIRHLKSRGVPTPQVKLFRAQRLARNLGKSNTKAGRNGNVRWLLFGWPEKAEVKELTERLRPIIEASLAASLGGR